MKSISTIIFITFLSHSLSAQEDTPVDRPVREPFASGILIDNQTTVIPVKKTIEYIIQHKFGTINNGFSDLFGLYAPGADIRMALNYVPLKNLQIGYGLSRIRMYNDFSIKYTILEQTRENTIPVAVGFFVNTAIDGRNKELFGVHYKSTNRFSFFSQLIVGRKINEKISLQANAAFTHYNITEQGIDHDKVSVGVNGRLNISAQSSILFQYDLPLHIQAIAEHREFLNPARPNIGIGWEIRTSAHAFHLYLSSNDGMIPQHRTIYNQNDWKNGDMMFGFSITRLYNL
jgi:hypothetical protein